MFSSQFDASSCYVSYTCYTQVCYKRRIPLHHLFPSIQILRMAVSLTNRILVHMGKLSSNPRRVKTLFVQYSAHCVTKPTPSSKPFRQYEFTGCLRLRAILPSSISCVESKHRPNHHRLWRPSWILFGMTKKKLYL